MDNTYNDLEKLYLTEDEIEYIKHTLINYDYKNLETQKWLGWRRVLISKILLKGNASPEEIMQYERLREIEFLFTIFQDEYCKSIIELSEKSDLMDKIELDFNTKVMVEHTMLEVDDFYDQKNLETLLENEYDQNLEEPFVQDLVAGLMKSEEEEKEFIKLERIIQAAEFKYIDGKTLLSIATLLLKEYEKAAQNNQTLYVQTKGLEKSKCVYLMLSNLKYSPIVLGYNPNGKKNKK